MTNRVVGEDGDFKCGFLYCKFLEGLMIVYRIAGVLTLIVALICGVIKLAEPGVDYGFIAVYFLVLTAICVVIIHDMED